MCLLGRPVPGRVATDGGGTRTADEAAYSFAARMSARDPRASRACPRCDGGRPEPVGFPGREGKGQTPATDWIHDR